jgi:hypothetical protein
VVNNNAVGIATPSDGLPIALERIERANHALAAVVAHSSDAVVAGATGVDIDTNADPLTHSKT